MHKLFSFLLLLIIFTHTNLYAKSKENSLYVYNWAHYINPESIAEFEQNNNVKIYYDHYDSDYTLDAKLVSGRTGYDIVVPTFAPFLIKEVNLGIMHKIDRNKLKNFVNLDKRIIKLMDESEAGMYGIPWMWGTTGIGADMKKVKEIMPDAPLDSLSMIFNPEYVSKFAKCGVAVVEAPNEIIQNALVYAGLDPYTTNPEDLKKAEEILMAVRPYIKQFHASKHIDDLANGDLCLVFSFSGDIMQSKNAANDAGNDKVDIHYFIPKEKVLVWIDTFAILKDASNIENSYKFIDHLLDAKVAAANTEYIGFTAANSASIQYLPKEIQDDNEYYPPNEIFNRVYLSMPASKEMTRMRTRIWLNMIASKKR
jgi:putrescine transport system substrate-binding protein